MPELPVSAAVAQGSPLAERLALGPLTPREAAELMATVARTVHGTHQRGSLNGHLNPTNILLASGGREPPEGSARSPAFSSGGSRPPLAVQLLPDSSSTPSESVSSSASYLSPEQVEEPPREVTTSTDIYALGAILYECLTGRPPFLGETPEETVELLRTSTPVPLWRLVPNVPRDLEAICLKCLEKAPERRYASAHALAEDLGRFLDGEPVLARPVGSLERLHKWIRRRPRIAGLAALGLLFLVGGLIGTFLLWQRTSTALDAATADRLRAEDTIRKEVDARLREAEQGQRTRNVLQEALVSLYLTSLALADQERRAGNIGRAEELLDACPPEQRGWEWHHAKRRCQYDRIALGIAVASLALDPQTGPLPFLALLTHRPGQAVQVLSGHAEPIRHLVFSPDGNRLASCSADGTVRVWDLATGKMVCAVPSSAERLALSPDGKVLATAGGNRQQPSRPGELYLRDATDGKILVNLSGGHTMFVTSVVFSPDGKRLASASGDMVGNAAGEVKVWDVATGRELLTVQPPIGCVAALTFSPGGRQLAVASMEGVVQVCDAVSGKPLATWKGGKGAALTLAYSPDGRRLAVGGKGQVLIRDIQTGHEALVLRPHLDLILGLSFSRDGRRLAATSRNAETNQADLKLWDTVSGREVLSLPGDLTVAFSPDGRRLAAGLSSGKDVVVWDGTPGPEQLVLRGQAGSVYGLAVSPDGKLIAAGFVDPVIRVWDWATGQEVHRLHGHQDSVFGLAFSPDGKLLASASTDHTVRLWDVASGKVRTVLKGHRDWVRAVQFSPDGRHLATAGHDHTVRIWDATTGRQEHVLTAHTDWVLAVTYSPDGGSLASASRDRTVQIWDSSTGQERLRLTPKEGVLTDVVFSPDGRRLATAGSDHLVRVWDAATGKELRTFPGHGEKVFSVAFSPDGRRLASGGGDQAIRIWDLASGKETAVLRGHTNLVHRVLYSADGKHVISGSFDETVRVWTP